MAQHGANLQVSEREARAKGMLGYCAWDALPVNYPGLSTQVEFAPIDFEAVRFERRTDRYVEARGLGAEARDERLIALAAAHGANMAAWSTVAGSRKDGTGLVPWHRHPIEHIPIVMITLSVLLAGQDLAAGQPPVPALIGIAIAAGLWLGMAWWIRRGGIGRTEAEPLNAVDISAALARRACPDCGYGLNGVRPAIDPAPLGGVDVGPEICPECTSKWPLVPPPAGLAPKANKRRKQGVLSSG